ncbi:MAG TPA: DMT family transporter [Gaiellaceae bacterium]
MLQREPSVGTTTQLAGRALFASMALVAYVSVSTRGGATEAFRSIGRAGFAVAVSTAVASAAFIVALNHTSVAGVLFMRAVAPIAAALLARVALGEAITGRAWAAMLLALCGVGLIVGGPGSGHALGTGISLVMTLAFAVSIVITRHRRDISMAPATCLSQILVFVAAAPLAHPGTIGGHDLVLLITLGVGQMGLGLALFTIGARLIPAAEVALITLSEIVLGPLWVWIALSEQPSAATLAGGAIVTIAVALQASDVKTNQNSGPAWKTRHSRA